MLTTVFVTTLLAIHAASVQAGPIALNDFGHDVQVVSLHQDSGWRDVTLQSSLLDKREVSAVGSLESTASGNVKAAANPTVPAINVKEEHLKKDVLGRPLIGKLGFGGGGIIGGVAGTSLFQNFGKDFCLADC